MKKLFFFIFLTSCVTTNTDNIKKNEIFDFNNGLSFEEFSQLLIKYSQSTPYPNIDE